MTKILGAMAVLIAVIAFDQRPAQAKVAPWCAVLSNGRDSVYWDCQYRSFEDCYPHLFQGNRGFCNENPAYQDVAPPARSRASRRQRS
jgi:hypothetical protein